VEYIKTHSLLFLIQCEVLTSYNRLIFVYPVQFYWFFLGLKKKKKKKKKKEKRKKKKKKKKRKKKKKP